MKDKIFICYRREDTAGYAALLHARLTEKLGMERVFIDIDSIGPGIDFVDSIAKAITASALVLVLIGRRWSPPRLGNPRDFVRIELLTALEQNARIIPLLFEGVEMPRPEELPAELVPLAQRNAVEIGTSRLNAEIRDFVEEIERILAGDRERSNLQRPQSPPPLPFHQPSPPAYVSPPGEPRIAAPTPHSGGAGRGRTGFLVLGIFVAIILVAMLLAKANHPEEEPAEETPATTEAPVTTDTDSMMTTETTSGGMGMTTETMGATEPTPGAAESSPPITVNVANKCNKPMYLALLYRDLTDEWVIRGWWKVDAGTTTTFSSLTRNRSVYFFADNRPENLRWSGDGQEGSSDQQVPDEGFTHQLDQPFNYQNTRTVSFFRSTLDEGLTELTHSFTCEGTK